MEAFVFPLLFCTLLVVGGLIEEFGRRRRKSRDQVTAVACPHIPAGGRCPRGCDRPRATV